MLSARLVAGGVSGGSLLPLTGLATLLSAVVLGSAVFLERNESANELEQTKVKASGTFAVEDGVL